MATWSILFGFLLAYNAWLIRQFSMRQDKYDTSRVRLGCSIGGTVASFLTVAIMSHEAGYDTIGEAAKATWENAPLRGSGLYVLWLVINLASLMTAIDPSLFIWLKKHLMDNGSGR